MPINAKACTLQNRADANWILEDFCLQSDDLRPVLIEGASGSGKTTVLKYLMGDNRVIAKDSTITFGIENFFVTPLEARKRKWFCYVGADHTFLNWCSIFESIEKLSKMFGCHIQLRDEYLTAHLKLLGLSSAHLSKRPHELSFGERRRLSIIFGVIMKPKILIIDEIFTGLDEYSSIAIAQYITTCELLRTSVLIITSHEPRALASLNVRRFRVDQIETLGEKRRSRFSEIET